MMRNLVVIGFLALFFTGGIARAEGSHDEAKAKAGGTGTTGAPDATRPPGSTDLREKEINLLATEFPNLGATFIKNRYSKTLPDALVKATTGAKDETETSKIMAQLFGTVEKEQLSAIVKKAEAEKAAEVAKETNRDQKYIDLLDRLAWAGNALEGKLSKEPDAQAFLKKFVGENLDFRSGDFKAKQDENEQIRQKISSAANGNEADKKFLRENLNRDAVLNFAKNNKEIGKQVVDAVSSNKDGFKFVDMVGPNNQPFRLVLGKTSEEIPGALNAWATAKGAFPQLAANAFENVPPDTTWYVKDGKLEKGLPPGFTGGGATGGAVATKTGNPTPTGGTPSGGAFSEAAAKTLVAQSCTGCHGGEVSGNTPATFKFTKDGQNYNLAQTIAAVNSTKGRMNTQVPAGVRSQLESWASQQ